MTISADWLLAARQSDDPVLYGRGPAECSSSTTLSVVHVWVYDVNGYYRELGVHPSATKRDLRLAYMAKDGQSSVRLTYILKQLLNPAVRAEYDRTPLGELYLDDYVREQLKRAIEARQAQIMEDLARRGVDTSRLDEEGLARDIAASMGAMFEGDDDTPDETVDGGPGVGQDVARPAKFDYAYYLWAIKPTLDETESTVRLVRLAEWQRLLVRALSDEGVQMKFAVGIHGKPHRWVQAQIGYRMVFLLNALEDPTEDLAAAAVRAHLRAQATPLATTSQR